MASDESSFDVVSKVDLQVIDDVVNAANKEIEVRFDFRGSISKLELDKKKAEITIVSDDEGKLKRMTRES
jgi:cyclic-di-GMP-binding protein